MRGTQQARQRWVYRPRQVGIHYRSAAGESETMMRAGAETRHPTEGDMAQQPSSRHPLGCNLCFALLCSTLDPGSPLSLLIVGGVHKGASKVFPI